MKALLYSNLMMDLRMMNPLRWIADLLILGQVLYKISHLYKLISLDLSFNGPLTLEGSAMKMIVQNLTLVRDFP